MALKFVDSFDHYAIGDIAEKWTQIYGGIDTSIFSINAGGGRRGTYGFKVSRTTSTAIPKALAKVVGAGSTTCIFGFAFRATGAASGWGALYTPAGAGNSLNMSSANSGTNDWGTNVLASVRYGAYTHTALSINNNGTISIYRGKNSGYNGTTTGLDRIASTVGTTDNALQFGQTYYIEYKTVVHGSAGSVQLEVNGDTWYSATGIDTTADSGAVAWQEILVGALQCRTELTNWFFDDLYIADTDASDVNNTVVDLVGDVRIDYRNVFQDGAMQEWDPLSGGSHFVEVDEIPPDDDTTYNSTSTAGEIDTFIKDPLPVTGATVVAMAPIYSRRRTMGGISSTAAVIRIGSTNYAGPSVGDPSTYTYNQWIVNKKPSDQSALDQTSVDAMEIGYKKVE